MESARVGSRGVGRLKPLSGAIAVVGYGNQGRAHALNLRDSGLDVRVGTRPGTGQEKAVRDGWLAFDIRQAVQGAEIVVMLVPDEAMADVFDNEVRPNLKPNAGLMFAHGFAVTYGQVEWSGPKGLVSPAGPGTSVREQYLAGSGVPALVAANPEEWLPVVESYAHAIGCARVGTVKTTFKEETECDLFGEQVVLCGGMPELAAAAFETLVAHGFNPEVAYTECVSQIRLLADLIARYGIAGMKERISDTAEFGSYAAANKVIGAESRQAMESILRAIQSGEFAQTWINEAREGKRELLKKRQDEANRQVEQTGNALRERFGERRS